MPSGKPGDSMGESVERQSFDDFFLAAPPQIDREAIGQAWQAFQPDYRLEDRHLPLPVWARRPITDSGERAWSHLQRDIAQSDPQKAFCIYIHIPFCSRRCDYCDCYSFPLKRHREKHITEFADALIREIDQWGQIRKLRQRPVSTVHFGGGTPTFLDPPTFAQIVDACRGTFHTDDPPTEWALETTTAELTPEISERLVDIGFTRLHIGIQTLDDGIRESLGRLESGEAALNKIAAAVSQGWIASVDLIYGLPDQTIETVIEDIRLLEAASVDGFSLYELQQSPRNRAFIERHQLQDCDRAENYFLLHTASQTLSGLGYRKTLFNHYARERDTNLYFTFPERGEDCLALGPIADGMFGDYHYRHPPYREYMRGADRGIPVLAGGMRRAEDESRLRPLETAILSARLKKSLFDAVLGEDQANGLFEHWLDMRFVAANPGTGDYHLQTNGSWFTSQMMDQLYRGLP